MKRFNNLSTRTKLMIAMGAAWLLMAVVILIAYRGLTEITRSEKEMHDVHFQTALDSIQLRSNQNYQAMRMLEMMLSATKSEQQAKERDIRDRSQLTDEIIQRLDKKVFDSGSREKLAEFKKILKEHRQTREEMISLIYQGKFDKAKDLRFSLQVEREERMRTLDTEMGDKTDNAMNAQLALDMREAGQSILILMILGTGTLLFCLTMVIILNKTIAKPLGQVTAIVSKISSRDDLMTAIPIDDRKDEVGLLAQAFRRMMSNLRNSTSELAKVLSEVKETVNTLTSTSSEIQAATVQVASGTAENAAAIGQTTATVEEVRQAAQLSAQKAKNVSDSAQRVEQVSRTGQKAVEEASAGMGHIRGQMDSIAQTIIRLSEQSQSIGGIVASVADIADQSNLLAVNAAIEAARAGEQGKAFSVVAQEIKSLAEQSKQAATEVRTILNDIQKVTSAAVMATEQGSKAVESGLKQSGQAGESIRVLAESVGEAVQAAMQIVASSQQQVVGMNQIGTAMENVNQSGAETAVSMRQVETAAKNLSELAQKLKGIVDRSDA